MAVSDEHRLQPHLRRKEAPRRNPHTGYTGDLYGRDIVIYFHDRIRQEKKFRDMVELKAQITADVETARKYFEAR
jgi:hypothetical protein